MNAQDQLSVEMLAGSLGAERNVVERMRTELAERGWSYADLSQRMEDAAATSTGGVLHASNIGKLLRGDSGRHISIDQLVTLAQVFSVSVAEMLLPPGASGMAEVLRALADGPKLQREAEAAAADLARAQDVVVEAMRTSSTWRVQFADLLEATVAEVRAQERPLDDSIKWQFLSGVGQKYSAAQAYDDFHEES